MRHFLFQIALLASVQLADAQPAIYEDGMLSIPGLAVIEGTGGTVYSDVQLTLAADGSFKLVSAQANSLVAIDSVEAMILESFPVQVNVAVRGNKSVPCTRLLEPAIARKGSTFVVSLAESTLGPAETCIAMIDPFETSISLDVRGLSAGNYEVVVNGTSTNFVLAMDNP